MGDGKEPIRRKVTLTVEQGLHLTPISVLVRRAGEYTCRISLSFDGRVADARSVYDLMLLAAPCGSNMVLETEGDDAQAAADDIEQLFVEGFRVQPAKESD